MSPKKIIIIIVLILLLIGTGAGVRYHFFREPSPDPDSAGYPDAQPDSPVLVTQADPFNGKVFKDSEDISEEEAEEGLEDQVITSTFISDLAELIFGHYHPGDSPGRGGYLTLSFKELNMHYATDLTGLRYEEREVLKAREEIFGQLLQPSVIDLLVRSYGPELFQELVHLAETRTRDVRGQQGWEERLLTREETVEMLGLFAERLEQLSIVFVETVEHDGVLEWVGDYLDTVEELNSVYFEYWQIEDESEEYRRDQLADRIKELITRRENIRTLVVEEVAGTEILEAGQDVVYEAQWIYRRIELGGFSRESIMSLADVAGKLADMARQKSKEISGE